MGSAVISGWPLRASQVRLKPEPDAIGGIIIRRYLITRGGPRLGSAPWSKRYRIISSFGFFTKAKLCFIPVLTCYLTKQIGLTIPKPTQPFSRLVFISNLERRRPLTVLGEEIAPRTVYESHLAPISNSWLANFKLLQRMVPLSSKVNVIGCCCSASCNGGAMLLL